jgi:hypothetical protein
MNNEFKKSKSNNETRYTLESMTAGATGSGSVATATGSLGKVQKRGNILAQEAGKDKVPATTPRNFVAKNAKTGGAGAHKDKKKEQKQGAEKHKKPYMESLRTKIDQLKSKLAEQGVAEGPNDGKEDNFTIDDIKNLERIRDFETLKAQAKELIKGKPARRMKPEKISWFYNHIDTLKNPLAVIKMMYDLMLAGEGNKVIGSRNSMSSNSYRSRFGEQGMSEAPEDRTSYQVAKILSDRGIKYDPAQENELINAIGMVLVKELNMTPKEARNLISYDEDFVADTMGELRSMEQSVSEVDVYMESLAHSLQQVLSEKAVSKQQQKFMGMVHAAQKGEKPASKEVSKVAKDMGKKDAKDFASTKHKGLPEKKKSKK